MFCLWIVVWGFLKLSFLRMAGQANKILLNLKRWQHSIPRKFKIRYLFLSCLLVSFLSPPAYSIVLNDWVFYVDGVIYDSFFGDSMPTTGSLDEGFGTLAIEMTGAGTHNVIGFFDYEIDQNENTYYNEYAEVIGTAGTGQSWEVDEPGRIFGDIVDNVYAGSLDNTNVIPLGQEEDVSYAMGWNFALLPDEVAVISFVISDILPAADFMILQADPDDPNPDYTFYYYSELTVQTTGGPPGPSPTPVPEPATATLLVVGLPLVWVPYRYLRRRSLKG